MDYNVTQNLRVFGHYINNIQPTVNVYGAFVLGENIPLDKIKYTDPGLQLRRRRHLHSQPDDDR